MRKFAAPMLMNFLNRWSDDEQIALDISRANSAQKKKSNGYVKSQRSPLTDDDIALMDEESDMIQKAM